MNQETIDFAKKCPALTGSIATGKSTVARIFRELGGHIIDTDVIAREVVEPGQQGIDDVRSAFGDGVINPDGSLNRERLRDIIIHDAEKRKLLDSILHPLINKRVFELLDKYRKDDDGMPVIIDVPLLFEAGWNKLFSKTIVVYVPVDIQVDRLMARDNITRDKAEKNVAAQMSIEAKKNIASIVIDNSGLRAGTYLNAKDVFARLCSEWNN